MDELRYWLALLHAPGVGPVTLLRLLSRFETPRNLFEYCGRDPAIAGKLEHYLANPDWEAVERDLEWAANGGCEIITLADARYPERLHLIADPPPLLFVNGDVSLLGEMQLAMVGSRNPTVVGRETARDFARHLAGVGLIITSGLALGIDEASHTGAIEGGGKTIAVLGTGADRVYPARHRDLAHAIVEGGGALVTEFSPGTPPVATNFPRRNRIISGLSLGTLVVEAALRSGSLITARLAAEQGREVFAIPGSIHHPLARGCHRLIREGAKLVESAADILEELAPQLRSFLEEEPDGKSDEPGMLELDEEYRHLINCMEQGPTAVDSLVERCGLTAEMVSSMLLQLELKGYITSVAGGYLVCKTSN
jgi:DNA processing protein